MAFDGNAGAAAADGARGDAAPCSTSNAFARPATRTPPRVARTAARSRLRRPRASPDARGAAALHPRASRPGRRDAKERVFLRRASASTSASHRMRRASPPPRRAPSSRLSSGGDRRCEVDPPAGSRDDSSRAALPAVSSRGEVPVADAETKRSGSRDERGGHLGRRRSRGNLGVATEQRRAVRPGRENATFQWVPKARRRRRGRASRERARDTSKGALRLILNRSTTPCSRSASRTRVQGVGDVDRGTLSLRELRDRKPMHRAVAFAG